MAEAPGEDREALHAWMSEVIAGKGWSATKWAREAGKLSPTTITRFLAHPETAAYPKGTTIARLARAAGVPPPDFGQGSIAINSIPSGARGAVASVPPDWLTRFLAAARHMPPTEFYAWIQQGEAIAAKHRPFDKAVS